MKLRYRTCPLAVALLALSTLVSAQIPVPNDKILVYIDHAWDTLSRSMSDCASLVDPKVTSVPVLYLPDAMPIPASIASAQKQCNFEVRHLPRKIFQPGDVRVSEIVTPGLLYLPNPYVVPGGRFNEMYGWDSYFILLGLVAPNGAGTPATQRVDQARGIVENFFFEIENYGSILNANRTYYLTRSQPPFLSSMIREVYEHTPATPASKAWLARAYVYAERDHALWTTPVHAAGNTGLAHYSDIGAGPVPEMADDNTYYPDVIRWLLAHPHVDTDFLLDSPDDPTPAQAAALAKTSCDVTASRVCAAAHVDGHRLTAAFYHGDRAMRESGFDTSFRFGPFSGATDHYAPVCLNALLYKYERDLAHFATLLNRHTEAAHWNRRAAARRAAINKYLWNATTGLYMDYDYTTTRRSAYLYLTTFYPLWANLASPRQAAALQHHIAQFDHPGALAMSTTESGTQWDLPFGWAPTTWLTVKGLAQYHFDADATRIANEFSQTVLTNFEHDGTIREKYNVVSGSANTAVATGYKSNAIGFGWTNGAYLQMNNLLTLPAR
jgi:alpha,alpha-trehalase